MQKEDLMEPRGKRWTVTALAVSGLFLTGGGIGGAALDAASLAAETAPSVPSHIHLATSAPSGLTPMFMVAGDSLILPSSGAVASASEAVVEREAFDAQMRKLWEDHITWTRLYIVSAASDLPDQELTAQRLLQNQADIGDAVAAFYGDEAGAELTTLLEEHILGAADLLTAAKSGDQTAIEVAGANWYANADAIGAFLSAANPEQWPLADMQAEMRMHLDLTLDEATARLNGDYAADIAAYDQIHGHILAFADRLSAGIAAQFPERFV
jgi:hypothetical protein